MKMLPELLKQIYEITKPQLVTGQKTEEVFFGLLFSSYTAEYGCAESTVSRFFSGERNLTRKFFKMYMDPNSVIPRCPEPLYRDVCVFFCETLVWRNTRANLRAALDHFISDIPDADAARILYVPDELAQDSTRVVAILLTRVIWYAACQGVYA